MTDLVGQYVGRYHIVSRLGHGGMATVFQAFDTRLEREVAIKFIRREAVSSELYEQMGKRFEREAKAVARLSHPNIVSVHDYGEHDGSPYLVMAYIPSGTLKHLIEERGRPPFPWPEAVRLIIPMAHALAYAHARHIIHRDIKPANILITESGQPMLSDFGIAKILEQAETVQLTSSGSAIGTPEYMAPEQWMGEADARADIYSLGVVLYEMVTGHKPYTADTPVAILLKQNSDPLPRPTGYVPSLPDQLEKILFKALAKKAEERYTDMTALAEALEALNAAPGSVPTHHEPGMPFVTCPQCGDRNRIGTRFCEECGADLLLLTGTGATPPPATATPKTPTPPPVAAPMQKTPTPPPAVMPTQKAHTPTPLPPSAAPIQKMSAPPPGTTFHTTLKPERVCTVCGELNPADLRFCQECGAALSATPVPAPHTTPPPAHTPPPTPPPAPRICRVCGTANQPHMRFCDECGAAL